MGDGIYNHMELRIEIYESEKDPNEAFVVINNSKWENQPYIVSGDKARFLVEGLMNQLE